MNLTTKEARAIIDCINHALRSEPTNAMELDCIIRDLQNEYLSPVSTPVSTGLPTEEALIARENDCIAILDRARNYYQIFYYTDPTHYCVFAIEESSDEGEDEPLSFDTYQELEAWYLALIE